MLGQKQALLALLGRLQTKLLLQLIVLGVVRKLLLLQQLVFSIESLGLPNKDTWVLIIMDP